MKRKYPLTPEGVKRFQVQLFELEDIELKVIAKELSKDLRAWIILNFDLTPNQKYYYDKMVEEYNLIQSWQVATAIITRNFIEFGEVPPDYNPDQLQNRTTTTSFSANVTYSEANGLGGSGGFSITFK